MEEPRTPAGTTEGEGEGTEEGREELRRISEEAGRKLAEERHNHEEEMRHPEEPEPPKDHEHMDLKIGLVVLFLGSVLAAFVVSYFYNSSADSRIDSINEQVQELQSQMEDLRGDPRDRDWENIGR